MPMYYALHDLWNHVDFRLKIRAHAAQFPIHGGLLFMVLEICEMEYGIEWQLQCSSHLLFVTSSQSLVIIVRGVRYYSLHKVRFVKWHLWLYPSIFLQWLLFFFLASRTNKGIYGLAWDLAWLLRCLKIILNTTFFRLCTGVFHSSWPVYSELFTGWLVLNLAELS